MELSSERSEVTRERILTAALKLFSRNGYLGATTKEISREANIAEVTLFRHFESKERLFEEVLAKKTYFPAMREALDEVINLPYEDGLKALMESFFEAAAGLRDWIRIVQGEAQRTPEKLHKHYRAFVDESLAHFSAYLKIMHDRGAATGFNPEIGALALHGMLFNYFTSEELLRGTCEAEDRGNTIAEFVRIFVCGTKKERSDSARGRSLIRIHREKERVSSYHN